MTAIAIAVLVLQSISYLYVLDRLTRRHDTQVQALLQRIQAPDTAVAQHVMQQQEYEPAHLPFDDDEAWRTHIGDMNGH